MEDRDVEAAKCLGEVATILARGIVRLRSCALAATLRSEDSPNSGANCLEVSEETVLSGSTRVNGARDSKRRTR
jgi:hypothetical protein